MFAGLLFKYPHKYLYAVSLIFHLLETTILFKSTESNKIACLDEKNSFLSTSLSPNFIFLNSFLCYMQTKIILFLLYNIPFLSIITAFLIKFNTSFLDINTKLIIYALPLSHPIHKL